MFCFQLIHSCLECLGAIVNNVTHNYALVKDCFQKFLSMPELLFSVLAILLSVVSYSGCLEQMHTLHSQNSSHPQLKSHRAALLRSLFSVGVVCKFFDVDSFTQKSSVSEQYSIPQPSKTVDSRTFLISAHFLISAYFLPGFDTCY